MSILILHRRVLLLCIYIGIGCGFSNEAFAILDASSCDAFKHNGYLEVHNQFIDKKDYEHVYELYDEFRRDLPHNLSLQHHIRILNNSFNANKPYDRLDYNGYANRIHSDIVQEDFLFSTDFYAHYQKFGSINDPKFKSLANLLHGLEVLERKVNQLFDQQLAHLEKFFNGITALHQRDDGSYQLTLKLTAQNSLGPLHYDYTGLSILLDNDDPIEDEMLKLAQPGKACYVSRYTSPPRQLSPNSAILLAGHVLQERHLDLRPCAHYVAPSKRIRHSFVVFGRIPKIPYLVKHITFTPLDQGKFVCRETDQMPVEILSKDLPSEILPFILKRH